MKKETVQHQKMDLGSYPTLGENLMPKLLLDMDGVLVDFVGAVCKVHKRPDPYADGKNRGEFDMSKIWNMRPAEFWNPLTPRFWATMQPTEDCFKIVELLEKSFDICLLSSPSANAHESMAGKYLWIEKYLPQYKRKFLFGPCKEFCAGNGHFLVDDYDKNVDKFGPNAFLYPRPWNRHWSSAPIALDSLKRWVDGVSKYNDLEPGLGSQMFGRTGR